MFILRGSFNVYTKRVVQKDHCGEIKNAMFEISGKKHFVIGLLKYNFASCMLNETVYIQQFYMFLHVFAPYSLTNNILRIICNVIKRQIFLCKKLRRA